MPTALSISRPGRFSFCSGGRYCLMLILMLLPAVVDGQEQRKLRHILVASENIADRLVVAIENGTDFRSLARRFSLDVGTRILGGDLDWVSPGSLEPEFATAAFAIEKPGGIAKCKTRYGWHVVEFLETRGTPLEKPPVPPTPQPGTTEDGKPVSQVPVQGIRNEDLTVGMKVLKMALAPDEPALTMLTITNNTDEPKQVFNPALWPLGLIVRYQFGVLNVSLEPPFEGEPEGGLLRTIQGGETLSTTFDINQYADGRGNWPHIRTIWRGDTFFSRMEKFFPTVTSSPGYADWKARWRFYSSQEQHFNMLPAYSSDENWYLCVFARGQIWIDLKDPGIPGVLDHLIDQVRNELYTDIQVSKFIDGHSFQIRVPLSGDAIGWQPSESVGRWQRGTAGILRDLATGGAKIGDSLFLALGDIARNNQGQPDLTKTLTPIGQMMELSEDSLVRVEEAMRGGGVQQINLVLAYPESLVPPAVREALEARTEDQSEKPQEVGSVDRLGGSPAPATATSEEGEEDLSRELVIRFDSRSGKWSRITGETSTEISDLPTYMKLYRNQFARSKSREIGNLSVILEIPGGAPTSNTKMVIKMLQSLGFPDVSFRDVSQPPAAPETDPVTGKPNKPKFQGIQPRELHQPISEAKPGKSPELSTDPNAEPLPRVRVKTTRGTFVLELFEDAAPNTVANFIHLVESGFYKGLTFNWKGTSVTNKGFIQGGSPDGTRKGSPGYTIGDEVNKNRNVTGAVAMARKHTIPNTAGSQFFICLDNQPQLDGIYTVFGRVVEGFEWVQTFEVGTVMEELEVIRKRDHEYTPKVNPL